MEAGIGDRFKELPGDFCAVELGESYDLVLLTNFLHHFDQQVCVDLFVPNSDRVSPSIAALFAYS